MYLPALHDDRLSYRELHERGQQGKDFLPAGPDPAYRPHHSAHAFDEYKQYEQENQEIDTYYLAVQEARPLSNYIAEKYQVRHESPQALLFADNNIVWHASHRKINIASLQKAVKER